MQTEKAMAVKVTCDCGMLYETSVVAIGGRDIRQHPICPVCMADRNKPAPSMLGEVMQLDAEWRKICPPHYRRVTVDKLPCGRKTASMIEEWKPGETGRGMLLVGETRRGKTMAAWNGLRHIMRRGIEVAAVNDATIGVRYGDALGHGEGWGYIQRLVYPGLLFWDDFGKAKISDRYAELAYAIIETRMAAERPMIITTQLTPDAIIDKLGEYNGSAISERLQECCEVIQL